MAVITRSASLNDLPVLDNFLQLLVEAERPFDETIRSGHVIYYDLKSLIENENAALLVLEDNGELVGCGYALIQKAKSYLVFSQYAHLGFMYVVPAYRGRGLNQQLITELKKWALSKGISEMQLEVYEENIAAVKAYEKAGFSKLLLTMRCSIEDL
ncbi:GNAT family N-acetyltransferase [Chitinophaga rhizophila]|uniref:GNAT family N-acetyltransferase n=1 Tax=Chitinophaga rhizophila TaxID=2866212 RepID=A0ABS7GJM6_9BACT|nr:GNAT family N-acetyltransferase [Chitinophaga rhizophila]MBW8687927.1 GNAT family N-acetyltransferase [Chitinophaga rhizophila]